MSAPQLEREPIQVLAEELQRLTGVISSLNELVADLGVAQVKLDKEIDRIYHELGVRRAARRD